MSTIPLNLETDTVLLPEPADRRELAHALGPKVTQRIVWAKSVGYREPGA